MTFKTSDLCDQFSQTQHLQIAEPAFQAFGAHSSFSGRVTTVKVFEDNVLIRKTLEEKASEGVLVIDGGGSVWPGDSASVRMYRGVSLNDAGDMAIAAYFTTNKPGAARLFDLFLLARQS